MGMKRTRKPGKDRRAQMKIQEMAFVLVAIMIFFALVAIVYFSILSGNLKKDAVTLREDEAKELVRKMASSPEFTLNDQCASCIDVDKVIALKDRNGYEGFWGLDYLAVEFIYPGREGECNRANYPNCKRITIVGNSVEIGKASEAFVSLCRFEPSQEIGYEKCEMGRILVSGKGIG